MTDQTPDLAQSTISIAATDAEWGEHGRRLQYLSHVDLFARCTPAILTHVATALKPITVVQGTTICREGDPGDAMYLIRDGTVSVMTKVGDDVVELARLGPGQFFGEQALLTRGDRTATVRAATQVSLWSLSSSDFQELLTREHALAEAVGQVVAERQRRNARTVFEVERRNVAALTEGRATITIGRALDNDIVFESSNVSRHHAVLTKVGDTYQLRDLNSANGTSVNGVRTREALLADGDEIRVADERFVFDRREITRVVEPRGVAIDVMDLSRGVKTGKQILHNVTLSILPGEFVAVVGGSGSGKTTLMDAMSGVRPPTSGTVQYNGRDYYENIDLYRNVLGYVPQDDIIHTSLPLHRTLLHAARLRLPKDTAEDALEQRVGEVIDELGLKQHAATKVQELSGGQRKRSSIGVELLTRPRLIFLDEPTSGLDPATETQMMQLMRGMADAGSTVLVTTHATKNVMMCDKVVILARGGYLAFAGSPRRALQYFGAQDFDEIYLRLDSESSPAEWADRFRESPHYHMMLAEQVKPAVERTPAAEARRGRAHGLRLAHPTHQIHQFAVLTRRSLDMLLRSPANLFAFFVQPVLIAILLLALFKSGAFTPGELNPIPAVQTILVLCFAIFFFGVTFGLNEICGEFTIFSRERMVNLGIGPYVMSKVAVLGPLLLLAELLIIVGLRVTDRLPSASPRTYAEFFLTLALSELAGLAIGLMASSFVPNPDAAARILPAILLPQALFCGGFVARVSMGLVGQWISWVTVMRWSFEGAGRNLNVNGLVNTATPAAQNPLLQQYGDAFSRDPWQNWVILAAYVVVPLAIACYALTRRTRH